MALNDTITALGNSIINLVDKKTPIATANTVGMVKPDGNTISIDTNGVISSNGGGLHKPFDVVMKDHILSFEESKGLVQLGGYAYKEAVDGSRYGYSDFYNTCLEEYNNSSDESVVYDYNFRKFGNVIIRNNGYITASNFSADNYIYPLNNPSANQTSSGVTLGLESGSTGSGSGGSITIGDDEIFIRFRTGDDITTQQCLWSGKFNLWIGIKSSKMVYYISSNGTSWDIAKAKTGSTILQPNSNYTLVFRHNGGFTTPYNTYVAYLTNGLTKKISDATLDYSLANATANAGTVASYIGISDNFDMPFLGTIYIGVTDGTRLTYRTDVNAETSNRPDEFEPLKTVTIKKNANGHRFFDIADLSKIDTIYMKTGMAWFYGIDTANERIRIPRNDKYFMCGTDAGAMIQAGLPDHNHPSKVHTTKKSGTDTSGVWSRSENMSGSKDFPASYASISNSIYGNSNTVQTDAVKLIAYMVVGNTEKNISNTEVTDITTSDNDTLPLGSFLISLITPNNPAYLKSTAQFYDGNVYPTFYNYLVNNKSVNPLIKSIDETYTDDCFVIDQTNQKFKLPQKVKLSTNSDKTNTDGDLYFKVGNAVQNTEIINVGELTEAVNNKIDINSKYVDGQWVAKTQVLSQATTTGVISMDLSSYLPNDNYNYEVLIICSFADNGANHMRVYSDIIPQSTTVALITTGNGYYNGSYIAIPVGSGRAIYRWANAELSTDTYSGIEALAYRRIGTNG